MEYQAVTWEQVKQMQAKGIEIGGHTRTHPSLGNVTQSQLVTEIDGCLDDIQIKTGYRPITFCFPNGQPKDVTTKAKNRMQNAGCLGAVTAYFDSRLYADIFELRRFNASESD